MLPKQRNTQFYTNFSNIIGLQLFAIIMTNPCNFDNIVIEAKFISILLWVFDLSWSIYRLFFLWRVILFNYWKHAAEDIGEKKKKPNESIFNKKKEKKRTKKIKKNRQAVSEDSSIKMSWDKVDLIWIILIEYWILY